MKIITVTIDEVKPGACAVDMKVHDGGTHIETEMAKAVSVGIKEAMLFMCKMGNSAEVIEGKDIEQFVAAALEMARR